MKTCFDTIKALIRTEKGTILESQGQYRFQVAPNASKIEIKAAVEEIYNVQVASVNTMVVPGKRKRVRQQLGRTPDWKKAIVTLKDGQKIEVT